MILLIFLKHETMLANITKCLTMYRNLENPALIIFFYYLLTKIQKAVSASILVLNNDLYFDNGNMIIGINYLVPNQDPQCVDLNAISIRLQASFVTDLLPLLCPADYEYYYYAGMKPTKYFYILELIGEVNSAENKFRSWTQTAILNAWSKLYSG